MGYIFCTVFIWKGYRSEVSVAFIQEGVPVRDQASEQPQLDPSAKGLDMLWQCDPSAKGLDMLWQCDPSAKDLDMLWQCDPFVKGVDMLWQCDPFVIIHCESFQRSMQVSGQMPGKDKV